MHDEYHTNTNNKDIHYFSCSNYKKDTRGNCESRHYIRADAVEQVVMLELRRLAKCLETNEKEFAELLVRKTNEDMVTEQKRLEESLSKALYRNENITTVPLNNTAVEAIKELRAEFYFGEDSPLV